MLGSDIIGTLGVAFILIAYFSVIFDWLDGKSILFFAMNILGAGLACYASWLINYWPFVILEGTWFIVSIAGLIKNQK